MLAKTKNTGDEGYALTTLAESQWQRSEPTPSAYLEKVQGAAAECENIGTGQQVILQGNVVWHRGRSYTASSVTRAVSSLKQAYLQNLEFTHSIIVVGTVGPKWPITQADIDEYAWIIMWITYARPLGLIVLPISILTLLPSTPVTFAPVTLNSELHRRTGFKNLSTKRSNHTTAFRGR